MTESVSGPDQTKPSPGEPPGDDAAGSIATGDPVRRFNCRKLLFVFFAAAVGLFLALLVGLPMAELVTRHLELKEYRQRVAGFNEFTHVGEPGYEYRGYLADPDHEIEYRLQPNQARTIPNIPGKWSVTTNSHEHLGDAWNLFDEETGRPVGFLRWARVGEAGVDDEWLALFSRVATDLTNVTELRIPVIDPIARRLVVSESTLAEVATAGRRWLYVAGRPGSIRTGQFQQFVPDSPELPRPNGMWRYTVDSQGFRIRIHPEREGAKRVLFLGDSVLFGWGVHDHETLTARLGNIFAAQGEAPVECLNLGVPGYNTEQEYLSLVENYDRFRPDAVVVCQVSNDLEPQLVVPERPQRVYRHVRFDSWFLERSKKSFNYSVRRIYTHVGNVLAYAGIPMSFPLRWLWLPPNRYVARDSERGWHGEGFKRSAGRGALARIGEFCRRNDCPLLVVSMPDLGGRDQVADFMFSADQVKMWTGEMGIPYLNPLPWMSNVPHAQLRVSKRDGHPNARATAMLAKILAQPVQDVLEEGWNYEPPARPN